MTIDQLQDEQTVRLRTGRYRDDMDHPDWTAWRDATLYVQRHKGKVVIITLADGTWAEYRPDDFSTHFRQFENEGYYLEIEGLDS